MLKVYELICLFKDSKSHRKAINKEYEIRRAFKVRRGYLKVNILM